MNFPRIGFGTYPLTGDDCVVAVRSALDAGYRYLDSAVNYENETEVGRALRESGLPRDEVQIATKIPGRFHRTDLAVQCLRDSVQRFGVQTIDVALIHWPNPSVGMYVQAWEGLVAAQREGLVRTIGVSNFKEQHLRAVVDATGVVPALNQIELHPYFPQQDMLDVHRELGVLTQAWSPLGKSPQLLTEPVLVAIADAHGVTTAQMILRWHLQRDVMPLPKSADPQRQRENLDVDGFELDAAQMTAIESLARVDGRRFSGDPDTYEEQ